MSPLAQGRLEALCGVISFLATVKEADDDRVWSRVTDKLAAALDCEAATYFVYLPKAEQLVARAAVGKAGHRVETRRVGTGQGLCGWVAKFREPLLVDDAYSDKRFLKEFDEATGYKTGHVLVLPLFDRMDLCGVLELINKRGGPFDAADLALASAACQAASLSLRALRLESTVDKVTAHNASILENLGGGFVAIDTHGRLMLCNPAAKKLLELPDDLALGQPIDQSLIAIPEMSEILMDTLVKKETVKRQDLWWKRNGAPRVLGYSTLLIQDPHGQVVGAGITFQDITQFQKK
ncbi:MAG TPA: GAF domain-containing protein [Elusimicrobiota bacterium]|nr:GAF domain-containing protein [Elusimicrobiota bacterium]